jgi:hypothetical protein
VRDPFALQPHSKNSHHQITQSSPSSSNIDRNWQSYVQQQYHHSSGSRSARSTTVNSGSITQGSPISPSARLSTDQQQYPSAANNQLVNPRYSYYINKSKEEFYFQILFYIYFDIDEQRYSPSRQSSTSPHDHSPKGKFARRSQQVRRRETNVMYFK